MSEKETSDRPAPRVLIVEDERIQARALAVELEAMGYQVCGIAGNGKAGVAKALEIRPDVVLLDIRMPGPVDGVQAAEQIRRGLDVPIIFVTAYADTETLHRAKVTGPLGYVLKPVESNELRTAIEVALFNHGAARRVRESEARYRGLYEGVPIGLFRSDAQGYLTDVNEALVKMLRYPDRQALLGVQTISLLADPVQAQRVAELQAKSASGVADLRVRRHDGSVGWFRNSARAQLAADGTTAGFEGTLEDITRRKNAEETAKAAAARTQALAHAASRLNARLDVNTVTGAICEETARALGLPAAVVMSYDEKRDHFTFANGWGLDRAIVRDIPALPGADVRANLHPGEGTFALADLVDSGSKPVTVLAERTALRQAFGCVMERDGRLVGLLVALSQSDRGSPAEDEKALVRGFADIGAQAMDNALLYERQRRHVQRLAAVNALARSLAEATELTSMYDLVGRAVLQLMHGASSVSVGLKDAALGAVECVYWRNAEGETGAGQHAGYDALAAFRLSALAEAKPLILTEAAEADPQAPASALCAPLLSRERATGVLEVRGAGPNLFDNDDSDLLGLIANTAAVTMENARLASEQRQALEARLVALEALRLSEERHRLLFQAMDQGVIYQDGSGRILQVNPAAERIFGLTSAEMAERPVTDPRWHNLHEDGRRMPPDEFPSAIARRTGQPATGIVYGVKDASTGVCRWVEASAIPHFHQGESVPYQVSITITDITTSRQQRRELEALVATATALRRAETRDEMIQAVLEQVMTALNAEAAAVLSVDDTGERAFFERGLGLWQPRSGERLDARSSRAVASLLGGRSDIGQTDGQGDGHPDAGLFGPACRVAAFPLMAQGQTVGLLCAGWSSPRAATPEEADARLALLSAMGDIAASAMQRANLYQQTQKQLGRLNALHAIELAISGTADLRLSLRVVLDAVISELGVDAAGILLSEPHGHNLRYLVSRGFRFGAVQTQPVALGEGLAGRAALERQLTGGPTQSDASGSARRAPALKQEGFVGQYCVPLVARGAVRGVMEVLHRSALTADEDWMEFLGALGKQAAIAVENARLFDELQQSNMELVLAYDSTLESWSRALDLRVRESVGHTARVVDGTERLARALGVSDEEMAHLRRGALLHDLGHMGVPDEVLLKPGPLTDEQWEVIRRHPLVALELLAPITYLRPAIDIPYCHHEKWDGTGYPRGLKGEAIPLGARIFAVIDVWDALTSDRPYRPAWTEEKARRYLLEQSGKHFDPRVVQTFLQAASGG